VARTWSSCRTSILASRRKASLRRIGIFNRSHYEEVLVVRVHPELLAAERLQPSAGKRDVWGQRYRDINHWEHCLAENGIRIVKIMLNLSRREQTRRFLKRIDHPEKNWKFSASDVRERRYWDGVPAGVRRDADPHQHAVGPLARRACGPQVVHPRGHGRDRGAGAEGRQPSVPIS
jgi:hypothetical protein